MAHCPLQNPRGLHLTQGCSTIESQFLGTSTITLNSMHDLHYVINLSVDVSHVLVLSYNLVNSKICLKQNRLFIPFIKMLVSEICKNIHTPFMV